jgi:uncharacterized RDD family membrane protein YckC
MKINTEPKLLRRTLSTVIDYGFYLTFYIWFIMRYGLPNDEGGYTMSNDIRGLWVIIVWFIYFPMIESIRGQTLGKVILGLKVVTKNGHPISFMQALKRHVADAVDFCFFGLVAFITIKNTPDHQRVGDLLAKTIVVGGEGINCPNCGEQWTLTADEVVKNSFTCPKCKTVM